MILEKSKIYNLDNNKKTNFENIIDIINNIR